MSFVHLALVLASSLLPVPEATGEAGSCKTQSCAAQGVVLMQQRPGQLLTAQRGSPLQTEAPAVSLLQEAADRPKHDKKQGTGTDKDKHTHRPVQEARVPEAKVISVIDKLQAEQKSADKTKHDDKQDGDAKKDEHKIKASQEARSAEAKVTSVPDKAEPGQKLADDPKKYDVPEARVPEAKVTSAIDQLKGRQKSKKENDKQNDDTATDEHEKKSVLDDEIPKANVLEAEQANSPKDTDKEDGDTAGWHYNHRPDGSPEQLPEANVTSTIDNLAANVTTDRELIEDAIAKLKAAQKQVDKQKAAEKEADRKKKDEDNSENVDVPEDSVPKTHDHDESPHGLLIFVGVAGGILVLSCGIAAACYMNRAQNERSQDW